MDTAAKESGLLPKSESEACEFFQEDPDVLVLKPPCYRGTYRSERFRIYADANVEQPINEKWPDLDAKAGDKVEIIIRRIRSPKPPV